MGEVSFHHIEFALSTAFSSIKLNLLALYCLEFTLMCPIPIDVSDNTRIFEVYNGIVDEELGGRGGIEVVEVVVFDPRAIKVGSRMCMCMEGNGIFRVPSLAGPYNVSVNANLPVSDISCHFILAVLVEEDEWVLPCITVVILAPPSSWVVWIIKLLSKLGNIGNGTRCGGKRYGGIVLSEPNWFIALYVVV